MVSASLKTIGPHALRMCVWNHLRGSKSSWRVACACGWSASFSTKAMAVAYYSAHRQQERDAANRDQPRTPFTFPKGGGLLGASARGLALDHYLATEKYPCPHKTQGCKPGKRCEKCRNDAASECW